VRASKINDEMKIAAVDAIRSIAKEDVLKEVLTASNIDSLSFGRDYIIPKPMDPRLLKRVARAVAQAAIDSGVSAISELPLGYMQE
jgi:malate dehydrogenase (oxaloacetate-decarboxylating)(NADP+)